MNFIESSEDMTKEQHEELCKEKFLRDALCWRSLKSHLEEKCREKFPLDQITRDNIDSYIELSVVFKVPMFGTSTPTFEGTSGVWWFESLPDVLNSWVAKTND